MHALCCVSAVHQELHESHLSLVEGSAFNERDLLHRAGLPASLGAMVLADRWGLQHEGGSDS